MHLFRAQVLAHDRVKVRAAVGGGRLPVHGQDTHWRRAACALKLGHNVRWGSTDGCWYIEQSHARTRLGEAMMRGARLVAEGLRRAVAALRSRTSPAPF